MTMLARQPHHLRRIESVWAINLALPILRRAVKRFSAHPTTAAYARTAIGEAVEPDDPRAVSWCVVGAIMAEAPDMKEAERAVECVESYGKLAMPLNLWADSKQAWETASLLMTTIDAMVHAVKVKRWRYGGSNVPPVRQVHRVSAPVEAVDPQYGA